MFDHPSTRTVALAVAAGVATLLALAGAGVVLPGVPLRDEPVAAVGVVSGVMLSTLVGRRRRSA